MEITWQKNQTIEKVMVFKPHNELPDAFKHLAMYIPIGLSNVVVISQKAAGSEIYLTVRYAGNKTSVLNRRHFWTVGQKLIYQKRKKVQA